MMNVDALRAIDCDCRPTVYTIGSEIRLALFGCMKIVPARRIIANAWKEGRLTADGTIVESTSGTFGLGLSRIGRAYGVPVRLVGDRAIDASLLARFNLLSAKVEIVQADANGSYQTARLKRLQELLATIPGAFWPMQYDNVLNADAYIDVADQLDRDLGVHIDFVVSPHGSGGSGGGTTKRLRELGHPARLIAVDTPGSVLFGCEDKPRALRGLGNSIMPKNVRHELVDEVHWIPAADAFWEAVRLHSELTLDVGPTSGAAILVAREIARRNPGRTIVVICPDGGERYRFDVLNPDWLTNNGFAATAAARPRLVAHPAEVDGWSYMEWDRRSLDNVRGIARSTTA
jgi:cysteine synthase A